MPHLCEQHCVAYGEDLAVEDDWKKLTLMQDIEILHRTVNTRFIR